MPGELSESYDAIRTWPKVAGGNIAVEAAATSKATNPPSDLASDPIRMIFPPNVPERRSNRGHRRNIHSPLVTVSPLAAGCNCPRLSRDKIQNEFAAIRR